MRRLRHTVIIAGLKKVTQSYQRISLKDIADTLHIGLEDYANDYERERDIEFIVAKVCFKTIILS